MTIKLVFSSKKSGSTAGAGWVGQSSQELFSIISIPRQQEASKFGRTAQYCNPKLRQSIIFAKINRNLVWNKWRWIYRGVLEGIKTSSQKLGRHASRRVRSVWKSFGRVSFGSKKFGPKILIEDKQVGVSFGLNLSLSKAAAWKNLGSKKLGDCGDLLSDGGELISDGDDLLADGGNLLGDGCDLLGDGGDLLGNGGDLLGDGGHHNVISTLCKGSEAVTEWKTRKKSDGAQRLSCGAQWFSRTDQGRC